MGTFIFIVILIFVAAIIQVCWKSNQTKNQGKELEEIINSVSDFTPTKKVIGINNQFVFMIDNNRKKIFYSNHITQKTISYNDIIKVEVIDNGKTIHQKSSNPNIPLSQPVQNQVLYRLLLWIKKELLLQPKH